MSSQGLASLAIDQSAMESARRVGRIACFAVTASGASALIYSLPISFGLPLAALLVGGMIWQIWRLGFMGRRYRVTAIRYLDEAEWQLFHQDRWQSARLRPESRVWRHLVWLRWNTCEGAVWALLIRAAMSPVTWRQLQTRLRLPNAAQTSPQSDSQASAASPTA